MVPLLCRVRFIPRMISFSIHEIDEFQLNRNECTSNTIDKDIFFFCQRFKAFPNNLTKSHVNETSEFILLRIGKNQFNMDIFCVEIPFRHNLRKMFAFQENSQNIPFTDSDQLTTHTHNTFVSLIMITYND